MDIKSAMDQWNNVAFYLAAFVVGFGYFCYQSNDFTNYLPWLETAAEVLIPIYILSMVLLFLYHRGYNNWVVVCLGRFTVFLIALDLILVANYIVSGRYKDGVDLVGGFMDMDFGWPIVGVLVVFAVVVFHYRKNSWGLRKDKK